MPTTAQIPVIILSNYGDPDLRERGPRLGAIEFLVKTDVSPIRRIRTWDCACSRLERHMLGPVRD